MPAMPSLCFLLSSFGLSLSDRLIRQQDIGDDGQTGTAATYWKSPFIHSRGQTLSQEECNESLQLAVKSLETLLCLGLGREVLPLNALFYGLSTK